MNNSYNQKWFGFAKSAKTKFDMCFVMDRLHWKNLPWVNLLMPALDKKSVILEYSLFMKSVYGVVKVGKKWVSL